MKLHKYFQSYLILFICVFVTGQDVMGSDWPMWRFDAGRTAASPNGSTTSTPEADRIAT